MNNYNQVVQLVKAMQTQNVAQAQHALTQLARQDNQVFAHLLTILKDPSQQNWSKTVAVSFLNNAFCEDLMGQTIQQNYSSLVSILSDHSIRPTDKRVLERSVVHIIDSIEQPMLTQFRELVYQFYKDEQLRDVAYLIIGCFCVPQGVDTQHIIYLTRIFMPLTLSRIVLTNTQDCLHMVKEYNQILKTWIVAWDRLLRDEPSKETPNEGKSLQYKQLLYEIAQAQQLSSVIVSIYAWMAQEPVYVCIHNQLYEINILKEQAAELHNRALKLAMKKQVQLNIYKTTCSIMPNIMNTLVLVAMNQKLLDTYECRDFVTNLMIVVRYYFLIDPSKFKNDWKTFFKSVIFPMMETNDTQKEAFLENPQEYAAMQQDLCEKQTFGTIKSQACKILQKVTDKSQMVTQSDFIPNFMINLAVDSIKNHFGVKVQDNHEFQFLSFDVSLLVLSVLSYRLSSHVGKVTELTPIFSKQLAYKMSPFQLARMYMFLSYNYSQLYRNPIEGSFWIQKAFCETSHPTTSYCANDFIFNVADQYYSDFFMQTLSNKISTNTEGSVWDAIPKFLKTNMNKISEGLMMQMLQKVYSRLQQQILKTQKQEVKQTINVIKLIQIIRTVAENQEHCKENPSVRGMIWKIILAFEKAKKLDFQDEIIMIIYTLIKQEKQLSEESIQVLPLVLSEFAKDEYFGDNYYKIINHYIMKGGAEIVQPIVKTLQTGFIFYMLALNENIKKSQKRLLLSQLLLLTENIIAMHSGSMTQNNIIEISSIMMRFLPQEHDQNMQCKVNVARALNVLFLCHMIVKTDSVINYLQIYAAKEIYYNYDIRVLLACIKTQILNMNVTNEHQIATIAQLITILANVIGTFRKREKLNEQAKKIQKKHGTDNRLKVHSYKDYEKILKYMQTPFQSQAKFQTDLANFLVELRSRNVQIYQRMIKYISKQDTQLICELCHFVDGNLTQKRIIYSVLRPKAPEQVNKLLRNEEDQMKSDEEEEEQETLKRKRVQNKKKNKAKTNSKNTKIQIE